MLVLRGRLSLFLLLVEQQVIGRCQRNVDGNEQGG